MQGHTTQMSSQHHKRGLDLAKEMCKAPEHVEESYRASQGIGQSEMQTWPLQSLMILHGAIISLRKVAPTPQK